MRPFTYIRVNSVKEAVSAITDQPMAKFLAGGTNLIDLMKMGVERPGSLIDISRLPLTSIEQHEGGVRIGAMARNSDVANHPLIRRRFPMLSEALLAGASGQLRNMATVGGNLMQRTRCYYFYDPTFIECNKRLPGSGCAAINGVTRMHAILGATEKCIAVNPSDMCVALAALNAWVQVEGPTGARSIPYSNFHRLPGVTPHEDTLLGPGELITAVDVPPLSFGSRSHYLKVRDRNSYAFALVSVAAAIDISGGTIFDARIALGGVAAKPWRLPDAEKVLYGRPPGEEAYQAAAYILLRDAKAFPDNAFKIELARRSVVRALATAAAMPEV